MASAAVTHGVNQQMEELSLDLLQRNKNIKTFQKYISATITQTIDIKTVEWTKLAQEQI